MSSVVIPRRSFIQIHLHDMRRNHRVEQSSCETPSTELTNADAQSQAWTEKAVPGVAMVKPRWEQDGAGGPSADPGSRSSLRD